MKIGIFPDLTGLICFKSLNVPVPICMQYVMKYFVGQYNCLDRCQLIGLWNIANLIELLLLILCGTFGFISMFLSGFECMPYILSYSIFTALCNAMAAFKFYKTNCHIHLNSSVVSKIVKIFSLTGILELRKPYEKEWLLW